MDESVQTVKAIISRIDAIIEENPDHELTSRRKSERDSMSWLLEYYAEHEARNTPVDPELGDVSHLPPELLKELTLNAPSELEQRIIAIIESAGGKANINTILVELYNRHKIIQKRRNMQNKLWRMMDNKLIYSVDGQKGVYTIEKPVKPILDFNDAFAQDNLDDDDWEPPF